MTTFDVLDSEVPRIEIYGSEGTLSVPDPNFFGGEIKLKRPDNNGFTVIPLIGNFSDDGRGLGFIDMSDALNTCRNPRVNRRLALNILDAMTAFQASSAEKKFVRLSTKANRPEPMAYSQTATVCIK
jgi:predicted dehydrogenase